MVSFLVACSPNTDSLSVSDLRIDTTNDETFKESTDNVMDQLSGEEKEDFKEALLLIMFGSADTSKSGPENKAVAFQILDGKTASEIMLEAEKYRAILD